MCNSSTAEFKHCFTLNKLIVAAIYLGDNVYMLLHPYVCNIELQALSPRAAVGLRVWCF